MGRYLYFLVIQISWGHPFNPFHPGSLRLSRSQLAEDEMSLTSLTMPELAEAGEAAGGATGLAAFRHLRSSEDIESFIANMAVPPPPSLATKQVQHYPQKMTKKLFFC